MSREQEIELVRKVGLMGLGDLRKIAPIGDLGYANGWNFYDGFLRSDLPKAIMRAFWEQKEGNGWTVSSRSVGRCCTYYYCAELGLSWGVDSSD